MARTFQGDPDAIAKVLSARIRAKLNRIGDIDDPRMKKALADVGEGLVTQAKINISRQGLIDEGPLRDSIRARFVAKGVLAVGSFGIPYARIHEFGFQGTQSVKEHTRMQYFAFGRAMDPPKQVNVRAHSRNMNMPARPYLGPAIRSQRDWVIETIGKAVEEILGGS